MHEALKNPNTLFTREFPVVVLSFNYLLRGMNTHSLPPPILIKMPRHTAPSLALQPVRKSRAFAGSDSKRLHSSQLKPLSQSVSSESALSCVIISSCSSWLVKAGGCMRALGLLQAAAAAQRPLRNQTTMKGEVKEQNELPVEESCPCFEALNQSRFFP